MNGVINIFKPIGMTSHDVVNILRKILKTKKIGHTGTLDPNASGVLPLCVGKSTRIAEYLLDLDKEYIGELTLGYETDTQDMDGKVINFSNKKVSNEDIIEVMKNYEGNISQIPPMHSALKHKGKKLYELAREGKIIDRPARNIRIYKQEVLEIEEGKSVLFYTQCSKGTYIRTLCDDIGKDLGTLAYMSFLMRVGAGNFKISNSYSLDYLKTLDLSEIEKLLTPMDIAISHIEKLIVDKSLFFKISNGLLIEMEDTQYKKSNDILRVYCDDTFMGIGRIINKENKYYLKMDKVLLI